MGVFTDSLAGSGPNSSSFLCFLREADTVMELELQNAYLEMMPVKDRGRETGLGSDCDAYLMKPLSH